MPRVLISSLGSAGDVHPFLAVGAALSQRGHEVLGLFNPHFEARVRAAGLAFEPLGTSEDFERVLHDPKLASERQSGWHVMRTLVDAAALPEYTRALAIIRRFKPDLIVHHHISFGTAWAAERLKIPTVVGVLAPLFWLSPHDPSLFRSWPSEAWQRRCWPLALTLGRAVFSLTVDRWLSAKRAQVSLPPQRQMVRAMARSGVATLGLWSPQFRPTLPDDPPASVICGFTHYDRASERGAELPAATAEFLERCLQRQTPPVIFTLGSSLVHHAGDFFDLALEACRRVDRPALLLTKDPAAHAALPPWAHAAGYIPHSLVLPRGCLTVHHGGIGTTAQGLRSGRPTVIVPFVNDEFDNAARAARLGVSITIFKRQLTAGRLAREIKFGLINPGLCARAAALGSALALEDGAARAADVIERVLTPTLSPTPTPIPTSTPSSPLQ